MKINTLIPALIISLSLSILSGCIHLKEQWPEQVPQRTQFLQAYEEDTNNNSIQTHEEYLLWVQRFYLGWEIYKRGWLQMTDELLSEVDNPEQKKIISKKMYILGLKISREWAKKTKQRRIITRHVAIWGNALLDSIDKHESSLLIDKVIADVDALLAHQLEPKMITENRYYAQDENNPFL